LAEKSNTSRSLGLQSCFQGVDRCQNHTKCRSARFTCKSKTPAIARLKTATHASEANIVLASDGRSFRYGLDCKSARIPALAAVSPKRANGPVNQTELARVTGKR
jgi:hypothetical protein